MGGVITPPADPGPGAGPAGDGGAGEPQAVDPAPVDPVARPRRPGARRPRPGRSGRRRRDDPDDDHVGARDVDRHGRRGARPRGLPRAARRAARPAGPPRRHAVAVPQMHPSSGAAPGRRRRLRYGAGPMSSPARSLSGKVAVVTGGGRGIGRAVAEALAREGMRVAVGDLDGAAAAAVAEDLGPGHLGLELDVTNRPAFTAFLDDVEARLGPLEVIVNNAGIMPIGPFEEESDATAVRQLEINVHGVLHGTKEAVGGCARAAAATSSTSRRSRAAGPPARRHPLRHQARGGRPVRGRARRAARHRRARLRDPAGLRADRARGRHARDPPRPPHPGRGGRDRDRGRAAARSLRGLRPALARRARVARRRPAPPPQRRDHAPALQRRAREGRPCGAARVRGAGRGQRAGGGDLVAETAADGATGRPAARPHSADDPPAERTAA